MIKLRNVTLVKKLKQKVLDYGQAWYHILVSSALGELKTEPHT